MSSVLLLLYLLSASSTFSTQTLSLHDALPICSSRKQAAGDAGSARKALPAGPDRIFRVSGSLHGDAPRLLLRALRDGDLQHPVYVACLDRLGIRALGKRETAQERARGTLDALVTVARRLLLRAALAAHRQHALLGGDVDVLGLDARQVGDYDEALGFFADVDVRDPADARRRCILGGLAQGALELPLEAAQERPGLVTNNGHSGTPH